jgi:hypothetical protein
MSWTMMDVRTIRQIQKTTKRNAHRRRSNI